MACGLFCLKSARNVRASYDDSRRLHFFTMNFCRAKLVVAASFQLADSGQLKTCRHKLFARSETGMKIVHYPHSVFGVTRAGP